MSSRFDCAECDYFLLSARADCHWQGPHTTGAFDPYPFRSAAIFIGVPGMILSLGAKSISKP